MKRMTRIWAALVCLASCSFAEDLRTGEEKIAFLRDGARAELFENILPFWLKYSFEDRNSGFAGKILNDRTVDRYADKNLSMTARILWFFSAVQRMEPDKKTLKAADRAYDYLQDYFEDDEEEGYYWRLQENGVPSDRRKVLYGHAFMVYGLSEYYLATGNPKVLKQVQKLFELIEEKFRDKTGGGYFESLTRQWELSGSAVLTANAPADGRTMNAHLHMLEAYANLYRAWPDPQVRSALDSLVRLFADKMYSPEKSCFGQVFDADWKPVGITVSYGHDLEAVWLLCDSAETLGDEQLIRRIHGISIGVADAVLKTGMDTDGGLFLEGTDDRNVTDPEKVWWPQAEAVSGFLQAWKISGDPRYLDAAANLWQFIKNHIVDSKNGEWFSSASPGKQTPKAEKISEWKGPYHNGRACMEAMKRLE
jgi:mannobiose 2-epimerase